MMLIEVTIGIFTVIFSLIYIYYKYVLVNFWRKRGVIYMEPVVPAGNMTKYVIGKVSVGKYCYVIQIVFSLI